MPVGYPLCCVDPHVCPPWNYVALSQDAAIHGLPTTRRDPESLVAKLPDRQGCLRDWVEECVAAA